MVGVVILLTWAAGTLVQSPADVAARTEAPTPSPILVPVEKRVLSSKIVTRGTARFGLPQMVSVAPSGLKQGAGLITTLPLRNQQLDEGDVVLTASGRPLLLVQGKVPAYRDMGPGIVGDDVLHLEQALKRLGFDPGKVDRTYDRATSAAVAKWYESSGWDPFGPTRDQTLQLRALEQDLGEAMKLKLAAEGVAAAAAKSVASARATAEHKYSRAEAELAAAESERTLIVLDPRQTPTARAAAEAKLKGAQSAVRAAELEGEMVVRAAEDAQKVAELEARLARNRADRLSADVSAAKRRLGVQVPVDEIVFMPALPVRVEELMAVVGDAASGPVMTVTDNLLTIDSALPLDAAPLVKPGMPVAIDEQALGIKAKGVVDYVADTPGTRGVDGYHFYMGLRVVETPTPLKGFSVRLTIPIESTDGAVTVVPTSAVSLSSDGSSRLRLSKGGSLEYVTVEPGLSADGFVEVTAVDGTIEASDMVVVGYETLHSGTVQ